MLRPPFAQERLRLRGDGRVALEMKTAWHDGTRALVFEADPAVIRKILAHLGIVHSGQSPGPAPPESSAAAL